MRLSTALFGDSANVLEERNFQLLMVATLPSVLGSTLVSPILETLTGPFDVSLAAIGLLVTVHSAPAIVLIPFVGALTDRIGRKPVLVVALTLFGVGGVGIAATTDFQVALGLRFLQGIGAAGLGPVIVTSIGDLYTGPREATAQGFRLGVGGSTNVVFPVIAGALVALSWQYPFFLYGIALPIAVLVYVFFEDPSTGPDASTDKSNDDGEDGVGASSDDPGVTAEADRSEYARSLARLAGQPRPFAVLLGRAVPTLVFVGFLTYNSAIVVELLDGTPGEAGLLVAVVSSVYAVSGTQSGRITAFFSRRVYPLVGSNVLMGGGLVVVGYSPTLWSAAIGAASIGVGFGFSIPLYRSLLTGYAPDTLRGGLVSLGEASSRVASTLVPVAMGSAIGATQSVVGLQVALQWTVAGVGIVGATIGFVCAAVLLFGPSVSDPL